jgi:citrate lyase beta subunit
MRDFLPPDVRRRTHVIAVIEDVYRRYGFQPLETPALENIETLTGKYGEEGNKLIFKVLRRGEHESSGETDLALRYDLTVPLARVVAEHRGRLPKFFKRYQIQPVWRADRPARGRFREFYQCDVDVIGSRSIVVEAEVCAAVSDVLLRLGFRDFVIRVNHRRVLSGLLEASGVPADLHGQALVALDKLDKVESAADLHAVDWLLAALEREQGIAEGTLDLVPQLETAAGVARVDRILQAKNLRPYRAPWRVKRVAFGAADYCLELGIEPSLEEPELAEARARLVLASRAAGAAAPLDSPWFHLRDTEGVRRALERSRRGGVQGRLCVHPDQVPIANAAFTPGADEVARAERIVAAFAAAEARGAAAVEGDGQMVDYPIGDRARAVLEAVREIEAKRG